jgi:GT2 family glycosyltransferase
MSATPPAPRLCALLTCFNRRETTLACLQALQDNRQHAAFALRAWLVDDGSSDGTAAAVRARFAWVHVHEHRGAPLFWCRGMHMALAGALAEGHDHYLLLNDDTVLDADAVARLLTCHTALLAQGLALVVGSTRDSDTGAVTYGGERRPSRWRPTRFVRQAPADAALPVDSFDGNVVLLPAAVVARVGNLDPHFEHAMGDLDYGLRASALGVGLWLAPGFLGRCSHNPVRGSFHDTTLALRLRWRHMLSRKGLPWRSWLHFTRRHAGPLWPLFFAWPYLRLLVQGALAPLRR